MDQKPDVPEPHAHHSRAGRLTLFLWVFFLLFVVYPLSIGPAAWLHFKVPSAGPVIEAFYTPLTLLADHSEQFNGAVRWYLVNIWRIPIGP